MAIDLPTSAKYVNGVIQWSDPTTGEIVDSMDALVFYDDFVGAGHTSIPTSVSAGATWCSKITKTAGTVTVSAVANGANGIISLITDATSEAQEAIFYTADQRAFNITKALKYEAGAQLGVIPTTGTQASWGVSGAWASGGPASQTPYLRFRVSGSGAVFAESYDGTTATSVATGLTIATTTEWHIFRIDATVLTNIKFFIDGAQVCGSTTFAFAATGSGAAVQPFAEVYKASGTSVGTLNLDFISIAGSRY